jgi:hypothetical protein
MSGASVQMFAPRRIGKTWLMNELAKDLRNEGWITIIVDVEGMRTEEEFLRALCRKLEEAGDYAQSAFNHLKQRVKQLLADGWEGNPLHAIGKLDPRQFSEALIAALNAQTPKTLILIDEIALFVAERLAQDPESAKAFLYHLRRLRQAYPRVQWLLTGSVGLDVVARRAGVGGALVDLAIFPLEPFDALAARSYLEHLCATNAVRRPFSLDAEGFASLARELGWLAPFYIKLIADLVEPTGSTLNGRPSASSADIERAFGELLRPEYRTTFAPFDEHIHKNFPATEERQLRVILDACCERAEGETMSTFLARLQMGEAAPSTPEVKNHLTSLETAGYLMLENDRWRFRSGLLRRYWLRYHHE